MSDTAYQNKDDKNVSLDNDKIITSRKIDEKDLELKLVKNKAPFEKCVEYVIMHFWLFASLLLLLTTILAGYFFYIRFPEIKNIVLDITGQNTPANSIKSLLNGYKNHDLDEVEKYADIDQIVDGVVDSLVENLKNDKRYSALFSAEEMKILLNDKLEATRTKYKQDLRNAISTGEIGVNWNAVGKLFMEDSFQSNLEKGNLTINGNEARFEITTSKGVLLVKMNKVNSVWKVQNVVAKDDWTGFLTN